MELRKKHSTCGTTSNDRLSCSLSSMDWNFDAVPKHELPVCCLWEYARESAFLHSIRERSAQIKLLDLTIEERMEFVQRDFMKVFIALGRSSILFQEDLYGFGGDEDFPDFVSRFPVAWQALSPFERTVLIKTTEWDVKAILGIPGFRRADCPDTSAMLKFFHFKNPVEVLGGDGSWPVRDFWHLGHKLRSLCPNYLSPGGTETLVVEIDWGDFTDEQLLKEFAQWLKENNPPGIKRPDGRGHNKDIDWRANLTRLGVMRLLSQFSALQIVRQDIFPAIWKTKQFSAEKWGDVAKWYDARREAGKLFCKLFPFMPLDEKPISWERQARAK